MSRRARTLDVEFWPGFTDVLAGMLLVMVFTLTVFAITQIGLVHSIGGKEAVLRQLEDQIAELRQLLAASDERADTLQRELLSATALADQLRATSADTAESLESERVRAADLARRLEDYLAQIRELNAKLVSVETTAESRRVELDDLHTAMSRLREELARMSAKVSEAERQAADRGLKLSELVAELERKQKRIAELERLERYTSEFLARLSQIFADNPNIKVVGDRFVFQSEVLFASGSADLNEAGKTELNKVAAAFRELIPKIPPGLDVNLQIQGHTDSDPVVLSDRFANNWELSSARALQVVDYLAHHGVPQEMMSAAGFGEHQPRVAGNSPEAKAVNRRIEIRITRR